MAHVHSADNDTYYLDQLCLIGICGAYAAVCLSLYFWQTEMLTLLLAPQFHLFVLLSGIALLTLVIVRSVTLWRVAGATAQANGPVHHGHDHHHHDHEHCDGHDHDHGQCAGHDHTHEHHHHDHGHDHNHAHDHGHDHDHSWAPWRYVVLLIPLMLFLLNQPNRLFSAQAAQMDMTQDVAGWVGLLAMGPAPVHQVVALGAIQIDPGIPQVSILLDERPAELPDLKPGMPVAVQQMINRKLVEPSVDKIWAGKIPDHVTKAATGDPLTVVGKVGKVDPDNKELTVISDRDGKEKVFDLGQGAINQLDFKGAEQLAFSPVLQNEWKGLTIRLLGQLAPLSDQHFSVVRYRIQCCGADAVPVEIPMVLTNGSLRDAQGHPQANDWVEVTGRIDFRRIPGKAGKVTSLIVSRPKDVKKHAPDPNMYIP